MKRLLVTACIGLVIFITEVETVTAFAAQATLTAMTFTVAEPRPQLFVNGGLAQNLISNGSFDNELTGWQVFGAVTAEDGSSKLDTAGDTAVLSQNLENLAFETLSFKYKFNTTETLWGMDEPTLVVKINDHVVFQIDWTTSHTSPEWQHVAVSTKEFNSISNLSFEVKNTGDQQHAPLVWLDDVRTDEIIINSSTPLQLRGQGSELFHYAYISELGKIQGSVTSHTNFTLAQPFSSTVFESWVMSDQSVQSQSIHKLPVLNFDPKSLEAVSNADGSYDLLIKTLVSQQQLITDLDYKLKVSSEEFFEGNWHQGQDIIIEHQDVWYQKSDDRLYKYEVFKLSYLPVNHGWMGIRQQDITGQTSPIRSLSF